jgi:hypothetical protein
MYTQVYGTVEGRSLMYIMKAKAPELMLEGHHKV